jgi:hypothetical protein
MNMTHTNPLSMLAILRDDPQLAERLAKKTAEVKKDKANLLQAAEQYTERYQQEIEEGTRKHHKMLSEGTNDGMTESEIFSGKFIPTKFTPIMNFLYFMMRDYEKEESRSRLSEVTQQVVDDYGYKEILNKMIDDINEDDVAILEEILSKNVNSPKEMISYIYQNASLETFKKVKKLKALTKSSNVSEATLAFQKCRELCDKYKLEYDRIPCNITDSD